MIITSLLCCFNDWYRLPSQGEQIHSLEQEMCSGVLRSYVFVGFWFSPRFGDFHKHFFVPACQLCFCAWFVATVTIGPFRCVRGFYLLPYQAYVLEVAFKLWPSLQDAGKGEGDYFICKSVMFILAQAHPNDFCEIWCLYCLSWLFVVPSILQTRGS